MPDNEHILIYIIYRIFIKTFIFLFFFLQNNDKFEKTTKIFEFHHIKENNYLKIHMSQEKSSFRQMGFFN